jgi:uncharacterized membrane protein YkoI
MKRNILLLFGLLIFSSQVTALSKSDVRTIIESAHPGARITEVDKETYNNKKVYEVDFLHEGKRLEAIIDLDGAIIRIDVDD